MIGLRLTTVSFGATSAEWTLAPPHDAGAPFERGVRQPRSVRNVGLTFLGTRGEIKIRSRRHRRHSALLVRHDDARVMIDCGADWLGRLGAIAPTAIVVTHAHPDHAAGLAAGAPCPVYASEETLELLHRYPIRDRRQLPPRQPVMIGGMRFEAFPVRHSIRAPAVGYRVSAGNSRFFYLPDVADFPGAARALGGVDLYIGDGATVTRSMVRSRNGTSIGHAPITFQLDWCAKAGVRRAIFSHCGSPIVRSDPRQAQRIVRQLGLERGVDAGIAYDGLTLAIDPDPRSAKAARR
ncbi:MAG TPA: MBL fold metallo-hydrolase [Xanthobacteraceae bacterium]|jgi:phosphoribosyl 1,2-cyclic phosphodiesterase